MLFQDAVQAVAASINGRRVTPPLPPGRTAHASPDETDAGIVDRDRSSGWTAFLKYGDSKGRISERRFTCHKIGGYGAATHITGYCHERRAPRTFIIAQVADLVCCETGEILDPSHHFSMLRMTGVLPVQDDALADVCRVLSFLARCDGAFHPLERAALETLVDRYCLRFDGTEQMARDAVKACGRLSPDDHDVINALNRISRAPDADRLARFMLDSGAAMVAADGRQAEEEIRWAIEISDALKTLCDK